MFQFESIQVIPDSDRLKTEGRRIRTLSTRVSSVAHGHAYASQPSLAVSPELTWDAKKLSYRRPNIFMIQSKGSTSEHGSGIARALQRAS